jgi:hypothetical protein
MKMTVIRHENPDVQAFAKEFPMLAAAVETTQDGFVQKEFVKVATEFTTMRQSLRRLRVDTCVALIEQAKQDRESLRELHEIKTGRDRTFERLSAEAKTLYESIMDAANENEEK